jgi:hypothetical protein
MLRTYQNRPFRPRADLGLVVFGRFVREQPHLAASSVKGPSMTLGGLRRRFINYLLGTKTGNLPSLLRLVICVTGNEKGERMTKFRIIGAAVLSLVLAGPAMAASDGGYGMHRVHHEHYGRVIHRMPAQDFDHFDFYHSGRSGPYGDGNYQGTVDDNIRMPPTANGG